MCQGLYHIWLILCQHSGKMRMCHPATRIGFFVRPSSSPLLHHGFSAEYGGYRALSGRKKRIARPAHGRNLSDSSKKPRFVQKAPIGPLFRTGAGDAVAPRITRENRTLAESRRIRKTSCGFPVLIGRPIQMHARTAQGRSIPGRV